MYFNRCTGELSETECGDNMLVITPNWFPYHKLNGKYVGCKTHMGFMTACKSDRTKFVETYEEMSW